VILADALKVLRCATYARYSTDMQTPKSAEDQTHDCMRFAERQNNWRVVRSYSDRESSSMLLDGRSDWLALEAAVQRSEYDIVIVERTDRIGREAEMLYGIDSRLRYFNCQL
jgi:site-specific DNA recombinase